MAFDPTREDYQRLGLRFARSLDGEGSVSAARALSGFGRRFAQDRDSLPQTDADRAFHLVAQATDLIDYRLPFVDESEGDKIVGRAHALLDEALQLDPGCPDALRMKRAADIPSFEGYYDFLVQHAGEVRARCEQDRQEAQGNSTERGRLAADLAMRPYLRWLATWASKAVVCGHNHEALRLTGKLLELDPHDQADVRFTAAIALAKLEDEKGLDDLGERLRQQGVSRRRDVEDAWFLLARCSLAYKRHQLDEARSHVQALCNAYPHAALTLLAQRELPDGVFARLAVTPFSEDELILAVSEATVLLQEGLDVNGRGPFGAWMLTAADEFLPIEDRLALSRPGALRSAIAPNGIHRDGQG